MNITVGSKNMSPKSLDGTSIEREFKEHLKIDLPCHCNYLINHSIKKDS